MIMKDHCPTAETEMIETDGHGMQWATLTLLQARWRAVLPFWSVRLRFTLAVVSRASV